MSYLTVDKLSFGFHDQLLFENLSFKLNRSSLLHLRGPNGAGKSTLLLLLTGLLDGYKGNIFWHTQRPCDLYQWLPADGNGLMPSLSAKENLEFWCGLRGVPSDGIHQALHDVGLRRPWQQSQLPVGRFSTGMKRRLAMARLALVPSPVWLLDEPLFGLDQDGCALFKTRLKQHCVDGGGAIVITHDQRLLDGLAVEPVDLGGHGG